MKEQAWLTGSGPLALTSAGQVEALDVFHGEDQAVAGAEGGIGGDDVGMPEAGDDADLAQEPFEGVGCIDEIGADDLEDLVTAHDVIVGEKDQPHGSAGAAPG